LLDLLFFQRLLAFGRHHSYLFSFGCLDFRGQETFFRIRNPTILFRIEFFGSCGEALKFRRNFKTKSKELSIPVLHFGADTAIPDH
jgi:hypothetical protein